MREPVMQPDALIIQDPTLLHQVDLFSGLGAEGYILINSKRGFDELGLGDFARRFHRSRLCTVPATELAMKHVGRAVPNAALLGGFAARLLGLPEGFSFVIAVAGAAFLIWFFRRRNAGP